MNKRRETILWSIAIAVTSALGLIVVWAVIALAFSQLTLAPLYFDAAPYRQDDYSTEGEDVARLNPLDPALEQEVILDDQARGSSVPTVNPSEPTNTPSQKPTNTRLPLPTSTSLPGPTNTSLPTPTNTSQPAPTHTSLPAPTNTSQPAPTNTSLPAPTNTASVPVPTKTPKPTKIPKPTKPPKPTKMPNSNEKLGRGVTFDKFLQNLLPAQADGLNRIIKPDEAMANNLQELEKKNLLKIAIFPDLDLIAASCKFNPNQERVKGSLSEGFGFTCFPSIFTAPVNLFRSHSVSSLLASDYLPQVAENNTPRWMDAATMCSIYNEFRNRLSLVESLSALIQAKENLCRAQTTPP